MHPWKSIARDKALYASLAALLFLMSLFILAPVSAQAPPTLPAGFASVQVTAAVNAPTALAFVPDGRFFVTSQFGQVNAFAADGTALGLVLTTPSVQPNLAAFDERGLLGIAVDPNFATTPYIYVFYTTAAAPIHNRISRYLVNPAAANFLPVGAEQILLEFPNNINQNHNGGALAFAPDGTLFAAIGDNQAWNRQCGQVAQDLTSLFGKIVRINPDGSIPANNPYVGVAGARGEIWASGLRNPFTLAIQPGTGRVYINDVGDGEGGPVGCADIPGVPHEEINLGVAGGNYAWPLQEGAAQGAPNNAPIHIYPHTGAFCDSITGGTFYNPTLQTYPDEYVNDYFFGDYCSGFIRRFEAGSNPVAPQDFVTNLGFGLVDLDVAPNGDLYYLSRGNFAGAGLGVFRIGVQPDVIQNPASISVQAGQAAAFTCVARGSQPIAVQWQRGGVNIPGATSATYTLPATEADSGATFNCVVTSAFGTDTSTPATLTVTAAPLVQQPAPQPGAPAPSISIFDPGLSKIGELPAGRIGLPGERITWTTTVTNNGGAAGNNIVVVDNVNSSMRVESAEADRGTVTISGQTVTVTIPSLAPGERTQFRIVTTVLVSPLDGVLTNTVTIPGTNKSATAALNVASIATLPATGETPLWRRYVVTVGMIVMIGMVALVAISIVQMAIPRRRRAPVSKYPPLRM